ncbi:uncharacterized protein LOC128551164 [Mercenaria mercenaria]|uniref:uncharacterized protein LOC128551164 n=1 Tax=Mercenaria mercenaria TaxID=6596 RepID=UPI00234E852E|nr:uncharacterized protein LOC128551164 [Mercenaria mercenaria]
MDIKLLGRVLVFVAIIGCFGTARAQTVKYYCLPSQTTGNEFKFVVRLRTDGNTAVTGITAVDANVNPTTGSTPTASSCLTTTEESTGIYALTGDIDVNALSCGIVSAGGSVYNIQIFAAGTLKYFTFSCDTTNLLPTSISLTNSFSTTGVTNVLHHRENPYGVKFHVFEADESFAPARSVSLGQNVILRMIYDTGHLENGPDNWGMVFHTGFIRHTGSDLILQIVTPGFGTNVHITGNLAGNTIDQWVTVKRDSWVEFEITASEYQASTATTTSWTTANRGLKIESRDDRIGVYLKASKTNDADQLVVYPDDILGKSYRPFTSAAGAADSGLEVLVVGTQASTVTIKYNGFNIPGGFKVAGNAVLPPSTDVTLNEYDVLHILCDTSCGDLQITSTENIAVVSGWDNQGHKDNTGVTGHSSAQVLPVNYYSTKYVLVESPFGKTGFHVQNEDPTDTTLSLTDKTRTSTAVGSPYYLDWNTQGQSEAVFNKPVSLYMHSADGASLTPALVQYPSISQWSIYNSFPVKEGISYHITIVTTKDDTAGIKVSTGGITTGITASTLGAVPGFSVTDVSQLSTAVGGTANYEIYNNNGGFNVVGQHPARIETGLVELTASDTSKPFMLLVYESDGNSQTLHLPLGVRYPPTNPCNPTKTKPGDNVDNDCDGLVDEEIPNGVDDDGNNNADEDLALNTITAGFRGIYVKDLLVDDNPAFSSPTTIHTSGCNIITPSSNILSTVQPFTKNTALSSVFSNYWVIETASFDAFKYVGKDTVYFRVTFDFCVADLTLCENSCQASSGKRKRSTTSDDDKFVDLMVEIRGNKTEVHIVDSNVNDVMAARQKDKENKATSGYPCTNSYVFWVPVALLLTIIMFETAMVVIFLHTRSKHKNDI